MHVKEAFLSDITNTNGDKIDPTYLYGQVEESRSTWPGNSTPTQKHWSLSKQTLVSILCPDIKHMS